MEAKTFSLHIFFFIFIFSQFSLSTPKRILNNPSIFSSSASLSNHKAERLIKSFNLMHEHAANVIPKVSSDAPRNFETQINFLATSGDPSVQEFGHYAGYYSLPHSKSAKMFYYFFESRNNNTDPVVIWLNGGPGCSGSVSLFYENGPFKVSKDLSISWNDFGWDKVSNIIYVDQPVGTGFSYTSDESDFRRNETGVSIDLYDFLQAFFKEHPKFAKNDFFIAGEGYAGHYIPALASRIHSGNKNNEGISINLKGLAIANGLTNSEIQYGAMGDYALEMKLISKSDLESIKKDYVECQNATKKCYSEGGYACVTAYGSCNGIFNDILTISPEINYWDVRKNCTGVCYDFSNMAKFLNQANVKKALGVGDIEFFACNNIVQDYMTEDYMINLELKIPALVDDGINLLVYAGEYDLLSNWLGNSRWVNQMNWTGQKDFVSAKTVPFMVDGKEAGLMKNHGSLTFLKVHDAGHLVSWDQPKVSLQMIQNWMKGKLSTMTG